jgi:phosphoglycolate phosphatase
LPNSTDETLQRRFSGYLFDLDGTLVDTAPDIDAALNVALTDAGLPTVDESLTRHWVGHGSRVLVEQALTFHGVPERIEDTASMDAMLATFIEYYGAHIADHSALYPGTLETLSRLRQRGAGLAVVTNKLEVLSRRVLDALDLTRHFQVIVCGDTLPVSKPDPGPALHACQVLGIDAGDSLFVGDSTTDVECARAAGCAIVCMRDGYNHGTPAEQLGADAVIDSLSELI